MQSFTRHIPELFYWIHLQVIVTIYNQSNFTFRKLHYQIIRGLATMYCLSNDSCGYMYWCGTAITDQRQWDNNKAPVCVEYSKQMY